MLRPGFAGGAVEATLGAGDMNPVANRGDPVSINLVSVAQHKAISPTLQ